MESSRWPWQTLEVWKIQDSVAGDSEHGFPVADFVGLQSVTSLWHLGTDACVVGAFLPCVLFAI